MMFPDGREGMERSSKQERKAGGGRRGGMIDRCVVVGIEIGRMWENLGEFCFFWSFSGPRGATLDGDVTEYFSKK